MSNSSRYLIINADDFGMCHSMNKAIIKMFEDRVITSASIMPVCPWIKEATSYILDNSNLDIGVHLTFTSEWQFYKWSPITNGNSFIDEYGYMYKDCKSFEENSIKEEVINEINSQIDRIRALGIKFTNIDNHMGSLYGLNTGKSYLPEVFDICKRLDVPFRFPKYFDEERKKYLSKEGLYFFESIKELALLKGIKLIDYLIEYPFHLQKGETYESFKEMIINIIRHLKNGVSELYIHPSIETEEIRNINPSWEKRVMEYRVFYEDSVQRVIDEEGVKLISWGQLKEI